jgi:hypothetical protein
MFNPTRDQARDFLFEAWRKYQVSEMLTAMESLAVEIISLHPEYHAMFDDRDRYLEAYRDRDYPPEFGETNPFLHINMHLSIREQVSINQPHGVKKFHEDLSRKFGSALGGEHEMMDCLGEMIWHAQRNRTAPDAQIYFACLGKKLGNL